MMCGGLYSADELPLNYHKGAIFTVELGSLVENGFDLGLKDYPIFDENYRAGLNQKIIDHFYFREIGQETPGLFKKMINRRMNEIMPYYNQLYQSTLLQLNPLTNYDMTTTGTSTGRASETRDYERTESAETKADSTTSNDATSTARTLVSVTPQMQLSGHDDYATNITDSNTANNALATSQQGSTSSGQSADTTKATTTSTDEYVNHVAGLSGITKSAALQQFRSTFLNVDMMVIEDLNDLFFGLYTNYWPAL